MLNGFITWSFGWDERFLPTVWLQGTFAGFISGYCNGFRHRKPVGAPKKVLGKTADEAETSKYGKIRMFVNIVNFELSHCCVLIFIGRHADIDSLYIYI